MALRVVDTQGQVQLGTTYVRVANVAPELDIGPDRTVPVGSTVSFTATASDPGGVASVEWDFDYGGEFDAEPGATGDLTPERHFEHQGEYRVVARLTDAHGAASEASVLVTVSNVAPTATVSANGPVTEGSPVVLTVAGLSDPDAADVLSVWVDWYGQGNFELIDQADWTVNPDGSLSFSHTSADNGGATGYAAPTAPFGSGAATQVLAEGETVTFAGVEDASPADEEAGFTYWYGFDGGQYVASDVPWADLPDWAPGTTHTVRAYVSDDDGGAGPVQEVTVRLSADTEFVNAGTGSVRLDWDGAAAPVVVGPGGRHDFTDAVSGLHVTLLTSVPLS